MATHLGDLGKFLSMMDFLEVVLFLDRLDMVQGCQLQSFDLMINSSSIRVMSCINHLVLIGLGLFFLSFVSMILLANFNHTYNV
jgi:hypothetical protein